MRLAQLPSGPWPPLLATVGPGSLSTGHAHHALHLVLARSGTLGFRLPRGRWKRAAGVLTAPDVEHELDGRDVDVQLVFLDPDSEVGGTLRAAMKQPLVAVDAAARDALLIDPLTLMSSGGQQWTALVAKLLGRGESTRAPVHPGVKRVLKHLRDAPPESKISLPHLATLAGMSQGRLMHAFTESVGIPLRPWLLWLKLQRAAAAIVSGASLGDAAYGAGFSDAAHMTRTFRRMLGLTPKSLQR